MAIFQHEVDPMESYIWTRNGIKDIRGVTIAYETPDQNAFIAGISKAQGVNLSNGGFRMPLKDFETLCRAFLAHLDAERGGDWPVG